jgi:predicted transport protein
VVERTNKTSILDLRNFVKSLGNNVIEEIRPHRIAYAKSLTFRTFLDIQPKKDSLTISLRKSRNESIITQTIKTVEDIENVKPQIVEAYKKIKWTFLAIILLLAVTMYQILYCNR